MIDAFALHSSREELESFCKCRSASEASTLVKWYMSSSCSVPELLCDTKIDKKDSLAQIANTYQDILQLNITMNVIMGVDVFEA